MPKRVYAASAAPGNTVKLGISARCDCISSVDGINSIIEEAHAAFRISRLFRRGSGILSQPGAQQPPRVVSAAQSAFRGEGEAAHARTAGGAQYRAGAL